MNTVFDEPRKLDDFWGCFRTSPTLHAVWGCFFLGVSKWWTEGAIPLSGVICEWLGNEGATELGDFPASLGSDDTRGYRKGELSKPIAGMAVAVPDCQTAEFALSLKVVESAEDLLEAVQIKPLQVVSGGLLSLFTFTHIHTYFMSHIRFSRTFWTNGTEPSWCVWKLCNSAIQDAQNSRYPRRPRLFWKGSALTCSSKDALHMISHHVDCLHHIISYHVHTTFTSFCTVNLPVFSGQALAK